MGKKEVTPEFPKELVKYLAVGVGLVILFLYSWLVIKVNFTALGTILGFILLGAFSRLPQRFNPELAFGIELVTLATISGAILYGSFVGALIGILSVALSGFYTRERPQDLIVMLVGFGLIGYFAMNFYNYFTDLGLTALALTVLYDFGTNLIYMLSGHSWFGCLRFSVMHIPSNYFILKYLGPRFIGL